MSANDPKRTWAGPATCPNGESCLPPYPEREYAFILIDQRNPGALADLLLVDSNLLENLQEYHAQVSPDPGRA
jgi:hypothetical protein